MNKQRKPQFFSASSLLESIIRFCLQKRVVVYLITILLVGWGLIVAPFNWQLEDILRDPIPVDAIPDIGENQQIVFTEWPGHSPQDVEDQITYPLTVTLMGIPGVKTIRSYSQFGFSMVYLIFEDDVDFYWSRTRVLEYLNGLPARELPDEVKPTLGPDATALGQVFWYTLEGIDQEGNSAGGWDLHELRTIQDWYVRYALLSVPGVSEVASVGGFVQEYQIDVDPDRMRYRNVSMAEVVDAVRRSNVDVGAHTIEINKVEYVIRGLGFIKNLQHIGDALIKVVNDTPILVSHVANISLGPAVRRGALDKGGTEAVGGVVVVRYGENPLAVIKRVKKKIREISHSLPKRTLEDGRESQVRIVPFYDRTELINETLGTLRTALTSEILVTVIVILLMLMHLRSSILISGMLPLSVLLCFIAMKMFRVDANIVALSGIAIAIGTIVDMGIIITENILRHLEQSQPEDDRLEVVLRASREVGGAVLTAVSTTIVSFLPVFTMVAAEGKLFRPLAFTKTFTLLSSLIIALCLLPALSHMIFSRRNKNHKRQWMLHEGLIYLGAVLAFAVHWKVGVTVGLVGLYNFITARIPPRLEPGLKWLNNIVVTLVVAFVLAGYWQPLGVEKGLLNNFLFVSLLVVLLLGSFKIFQSFYDHILGWCLAHKVLFLCLPLLLLVLGGLSWQGYANMFGWLPHKLNESAPFTYLAKKFPGLGKEFMPPLDEGSYLYMPVTMPHASIGEVLDILQRQDIAIEAIPEVKTAVGKLGRAESPLDPAPISMIETIINYHPEYLTDDQGRIATFRHIPDEMDLFRNIDGSPLPGLDGQPYHVQGRFIRDGFNKLIPDPDGRPFRLWRPPLDPALNQGRTAWQGIEKPDDIWDEIVKAATILGTTVAPKLQPISARIVMLQSGIRANMGVKVNGPDLQTVEDVSRRIEEFLRAVKSIDARSVIADRIVGKPYLEIDIDRRAIAQYGIDLQQVQDVIEIAIGGKRITTTVEGRERYPVRVRYMRELRDNLDTLGKVLVEAPGGFQVPLMQLADFKYVPGPQVIKSEDAFIVGYVLFDKKPGYAETNVVEEAKAFLLQKIETGDLVLPVGVSFNFTGNYANQVRADKKLRVILPLALIIIFIILYFQFQSMLTSALVFSGVAVAWSGGFIMMWLYSQPWFLDFSLFGTSMQDLFQVHPFNLSVAIWVGFLALFGIASDDGVVMATYLDNTFAGKKAATAEQVRRATIEASMRRVRPCLMTTATTVLALIPILTATGRGSDIMVPMAIPTFGGMTLEVVTMLVVPVLYCGIEELKLKRKNISEKSSGSGKQGEQSQEIP